MADKNEMLAEAYRRGLLPPDRKAAYEEAMRRGLVGDGKAAKAPVAKPAPQPKKLRWSEVPGEALKNSPESAKEFGKAMVQPILHPIETAKNLADTAGGAIRATAKTAAKNMGPGLSGPSGLAAIVLATLLDRMSGAEGVKRQDAAAKGTADYLKARYGSPEGLKRTMAKDPIGFAADVSTLLSGGGGMAARAPGVMGKFGRAAQTAGRAVDPINAAMKTTETAAKLGGKGTAAVLGLTTGAGPLAIEEAARAGVKGGKQGRAFREHMRGEAPTDEIVTEAKKAVGAMRKERGENYRRDIAETKADPAQLQFDAIEGALNDVRNRGEYKGKRIDPTAARAWDQIDSLVQDWKASDPAEFHTPEGIDALKRAIGNVRDDLEYNTPARNAADAAYKAVRSTIAEQVPSYSQAMRGYEKASETIGDIEKSLSLGNRVGLDTSSRKLLSIMRNNANTDYGRRAELGAILEKYGADTLTPSIAGQALSSMTPRAFGGALTGAGTAGLFSLLGPKALVGMAAASPRLVGEIVHGAGRVAAPAVKSLDALSQAYDTVGPALMATQQVGRIGQGPQTLSDMVERYGKQSAEAAAAPAEEPQTEEAETETANNPKWDAFVDRVMMAESGGDPNAVSPVGATGTMQTMPGTLRDPGHGVEPAKDDSPEEKERVGKDYLAAMLTKYDNEAIPALVAYNWGPANADRWLEEGADFSKLPAETRAYIKKILGDDLGLQN